MDSRPVPSPLTKSPPDHEVLDHTVEATAFVPDRQPTLAKLTGTKLSKVLRCLEEERHQKTIYNIPKGEKERGKER